MLKNSDLTTAWVTQHPPVHHPKNPVLGFHGWDETAPQGSVYLVSSFFIPRSHFFPGPFFPAPFFLSLFLFCPAILEPKFFSWELLLTPPTYLPPFHHPTHLPPPTYPTTHLRSPTQNFRTTETLIQFFAPPFSSIKCLIKNFTKLK